MTIEANPVKLRGGEWGARVGQPVNPGDKLTVVSASGNAWDAYVKCIVWSGDGVWLCETSKDPPERPTVQCPKCRHRFVGKPVTSSFDDREKANQ